MADQGRWFKLWVTADDDLHLSNLSLEDFARWCLFGLWLKKHGTDGTVTLVSPCTSLVQKFRVQSWTNVLEIIAKFPNIVMATDEIRWPHGHERPPETDGDILCGSWYADGRGSILSKVAVETHDFSVSPVTSVFVTFRNWAKYQGDFSSDRVRKFREVKRSKKRGEEKRREEKREELKTLAPVVWPDALQDVRSRLEALGVGAELMDPGYWQKIDAWVEGTRLPVYYLDELKAYLAHQASVNGRRRHKDQKAGFRNWIATALRWKERDAQREKQRPSK